jgi:hypothetical protein
MMNGDSFGFDADEREYDFMCPYCWQSITMLLDTSIRQQTYIEDCEICCNPIEIHYEIDRDGFIAHFNAERAQ